MKVFLDGDDLEVSDVCKKFLLTEGRGYDGVQRFYRKFGVFFSLVIMMRLRFMCEQAPFLPVLSYSELACIAPLKRAHA